MKPLFAKAVFFIWLIAIASISLVDYSSAGWLSPPKGLNSGFWIHVIGYFIGGWLYFLAFGNHRPRVVLTVFLALFLLGVFFEVVQHYIPNRTFNPKDIAANGVGLVVIYICHQVFEHIRTNKKTVSKIKG